MGPLPVGSRYGRLVVVELLLERSRSGQRRYLCVCDCGEQVAVLSDDLKRGRTQSCGCLQRENTSRKTSVPRKHGHGSPAALSPTYQSWRSMKARCFNRGCGKSWSHYGGRGITVCARWLGPYGFENFLADMGARPKGTTLDRLDVDGNYEPRNCRWATAVEQRHNRQP